jgi:hypothetical protein
MDREVMTGRGIRFDARVQGEAIARPDAATPTRAATEPREKDSPHSAREETEANRTDTTRSVLNYAGIRRRLNEERAKAALLRTTKNRRRSFKVLFVTGGTGRRGDDSRNGLGGMVHS